MGKLVNCKTCKKEIADKIKTCPHCGETNPTVIKKQYKIRHLILIIIIIIILGMIAMSSDENKEPQTTIQSTAKHVNRKPLKKISKPVKRILNYNIIQIAGNIPGIKYSLDIRIPYRYNLKEIKKLGKNIYSKYHGGNYQSFFIAFYTPNMKVNAGSYAIYNIIENKLNAEILDLQKNKVKNE